MRKQEWVDSIHHHIEECLVQYMTKVECVNKLSAQFQWNPRAVEIVWDRLENDNPQFFRAYNTRLIVKSQILEFNRLLVIQSGIVDRLLPTERLQRRAQNVQHPPMAPCSPETMDVTPSERPPLTPVDNESQEMGTPDSPDVSSFCATSAHSTSSPGQHQ